MSEQFSGIIGNGFGTGCHDRDECIGVAGGQFEIQALYPAGKKRRLKRIAGANRARDFDRFGAAPDFGILGEHRTIFSAWGAHHHF
jgi:hypothetical protein